MKYTNLGKTGLKVSVIGLGTEQYSGEWAKDFTQLEVNKIIKKSEEVGINFLDTAECYGDHLSESLIGNAIHENRENWIVATKFGHTYDGFMQGRTKKCLPDQIITQLEDSLKALKTDYIDIYQFHCPTNEEFDQDKVWEILEQKVQEGKIRHLGLSMINSSVVSDDLFQLEQAEKKNFKTVQLVYNRLNRKAEEKFFPICKEKNLGVITRIPLAHGHLSGKYQPDAIFSSKDRRFFEDKEQTIKQLKLVQEIKSTEIPKDVNMAQWALAWCLQNPNISTVIPGCKNVEQVEINAKAADLDIHMNN